MSEQNHITDIEMDGYLIPKKYQDRLGYCHRKALFNVLVDYISLITFLES